MLVCIQYVYPVWTTGLPLSVIVLLNIQFWLLWKDLYRPVQISSGIAILLAIVRDP